ncbi:MAG: hypothetical protein WCP21_09395 [Armatimonadota bacterium]
MVDDEADRVRRVIAPPLLRRGIELCTYTDIDSCLRGVEEASRPADLFIGDLMFEGQDDVSTGGHVALRFFETIQRKGWNTVHTLLTQYLEQYLEQLRELYERDCYAARLIADKGFFQEPNGVEVYADVLHGLLTGAAPPVRLIQEDGLPSLILQREIPESQGEAIRGQRSYAANGLLRLGALARPLSIGTVPYGSAGLFVGALIGSGASGGNGIVTAAAGLAGCLSAMAGMQWLKQIGDV